MRPGRRRRLRVPNQGESSPPERNPTWKRSQLLAISRGEVVMSERGRGSSEWVERERESEKREKGRRGVGSAATAKPNWVL